MEKPWPGTTARAADPNEKANLADQHPGKVKELQSRIEVLAKESTKPLFMETAMQAVFSGIFGPAPIPTEDDPSHRRTLSARWNLVFTTRGPGNRGPFPRSMGPEQVRIFR